MAGFDDDDESDLDDDGDDFCGRLERGPTTGHEVSASYRLDVGWCFATFTKLPSPQASARPPTVVVEMPPRRPAMAWMAAATGAASNSELDGLRSNDAARERRRLAREAHSRIRKFMMSHDVNFNGAAEDLKHVQQAWSIDHTDPDIRRTNLDAISGIASILKDYRTIRCQVHGETGGATSAPAALAKHLSLDPIKDVSACMSALAKHRAEACVDALIEAGCAPEQLFSTHEGMGGHVRVDFLPEGHLDMEPEAVSTEAAVTRQQHLHREHRRTTIRAHGPRHLPPRQAPSLRNKVVPWAASDLKNAVRKFPRLLAADALREWLQTVGGDQAAPGPRGQSMREFEVFERLFCGNKAAVRPPLEGVLLGRWADGCREVGERFGVEVAGVGGDGGGGGRSGGGGRGGLGGPSSMPPPPLGAFAEVAPTTLADLLHFDCSRLAKLGACTPLKARRLGTELENLRRVVTADEMSSGSERRLGAMMPGWLWRILCYRGVPPEPKPPSPWPQPPTAGSAAEAEARIPSNLPSPSMTFHDLP